MGLSVCRGVACRQSKIWLRGMGQVNLIYKKYDSFEHQKEI